MPIFAVLNLKSRFVRNRIESSDSRFLAVVSLFFAFILPLATYRSYTNEFSFTMAPIAAGLLAGTIGTFCVLLATAVALPRALQVLFLRVLFLILIFAWYNYNCLDYRGKIIGVNTDVFDNSYSKWEWFGFLSVSVLVIFSKKTRSIRNGVGTIILFAGVVGLASIDQKRSHNSEKPDQLPPYLFSFSADKNVLHIVLDGMQSFFLSDLLDKEPSQKALFDGFYFFPDTLASSDITFLSIASSLSGEAYDGSESISGYHARIGIKASASGQLDILPTLHSQLKKDNFDLDVVTVSPECLESRNAYRSFRYEEFPGVPSLGRDLLKVWDFTLIRALPWTLKPEIYRNGMPLFSSIGQNKIGRANRALQFLKDFGSRASASSLKRTYKLLHLLTPHGPWTTGANCEPAAAEESQHAIHYQGRCAAKALPSLFAALKSANLYDNTLIIIHGDHGMCKPEGLPPAGGSVPDCIGNVNPLLLIKPIGRRGALEISSQQAALIDLPATILERAGIANNLSGRSLFLMPPNEERTRYFFSFTPNRLTALDDDGFQQTRKHIVQGSLFKAESWRAN